MEKKEAHVMSEMASLLVSTQLYMSYCIHMVIMWNRKLYLCVCPARNPPLIVHDYTGSHTETIHDLSFLELCVVPATVICAILTELMMLHVH